MEKRKSQQKLQQFNDRKCSCCSGIKSTTMYLGSTRFGFFFLSFCNCVLSKFQKCLLNFCTHLSWEPSLGWGYSGGWRGVFWVVECSLKSVSRGGHGEMALWFFHTAILPCSPHSAGSPPARRIKKKKKKCNTRCSRHLDVGFECMFNSSYLDCSFSLSDTAAGTYW